jgi:ADP-heptose:LPS heptosyltransferase
VKILLIRLDHLGDLVLMTPLVRALAKAGHAVDLVTPRALSVLFEENPHLRAQFSVEEIAPGFPADWRPLSGWIKAQKYEALLLPSPKPRPLLWSSFFSGVPKRLALQGGVWGRLTGHRCLPVRRAFMSGRHYSDIQLDLARALGAPTDGIKLDYFFRPEEKAAARQKIPLLFPGWQGEPIIGIHPGWMGNTCNLPSAVYGKLAALILERTPARILVTGTEKEKALLSEWPRDVLTSPRLFNGMGAFDLRALAAMIAHLDNYVVVGTGPLHLAGAIGIRTTSPFCAVPPLGFPNWGNMNGRGGCVQPDPARCREWIAGAADHRHCDFRGEVTAEHLWQCLNAK